MKKIGKILSTVTILTSVGVILSMGRDSWSSQGGRVVEKCRGSEFEIFGRHPAYALGRNPAGKLIFQDAGQALRQFRKDYPVRERSCGRHMACLNCGRIRGSCIGRIWSTIPKGAWLTISWRNFWRFIKTVWRDDCCGTQQSHSHLGTRKSAQGISLCAFFFMFSVLPLKTRRAAAPTKRQLAVRAKSRLIGYSSFQEYILRSSLPTASS